MKDIFAFSSWLAWSGTAFGAPMTKHASFASLLIRSLQAVEKINSLGRCGYEK